MMEKQLIIKNNILLKTIFQDKSKSKKKKKFAILILT